VRWLMVPTAADPEPRRESPSRPPEAVDINRAGVDELTALPGVGRGAAQRIVAERERNGPFRSVADLTRVDGFDEQRVRRVWTRAKVS